MSSSLNKFPKSNLQERFLFGVAASITEPTLKHFVQSPRLSETIPAVKFH